MKLLITLAVLLLTTHQVHASDDWEIKLNVSPTSGNVPLAVNVQTTIAKTTSACDSNNLSLCTSTSTCNSAGGFWYNNICNNSSQLYNFDSQHVSDFSDWETWQQNPVGNSVYSIIGDTIGVNADGCNGENWHQLTKYYSGSMGISATINVSVISGCSQIGLRQNLYASNGVRYDTQIYLNNCSPGTIEIIFQKFLSDGSVTDREFFYFSESYIGKDVKLSIIPYNGFVWYFNGQNLLMNISIPEDAFSNYDHRRDLKLSWLADGCSNTLQANIKSVDIVNNFTQL